MPVLGFANVTHKAVTFGFLVLKRFHCLVDLFLASTADHDFGALFGQALSDAEANAENTTNYKCH